MPTVIITTDFSVASRHALDYACLLLKGKDVKLDLLHIFPVPVTYTSDGIALTALQQSIERTGEHLEEETLRVRAAYPGINIRSRVITGGFLHTLRREVKEVQPLFVIIGTVGFGDIYLGDDDPLGALRSLKVPVLFIPTGAALQPIRKIAFASNYAFAGPRIPVKDIISWTRFVEAGLQVVHTDADEQGNNEKQSEGEAWLRNELAPLQPQFSWVQDVSVLRGLSDFISRQGIDCALVVPRRHGLWQNIFHHSRTKALARLNKVPVIAFPEKV